MGPWAMVVISNVCPQAKVQRAPKAAAAKRPRTTTTTSESETIADRTTATVRKRKAAAEKAESLVQKRLSFSTSSALGNEPRQMPQPPVSDVSEDVE